MRVAIIGLIVVTTACRSAAERWYTPDQVTIGQALFSDHCASCHGPTGAGTADWQRPGEDGTYPPPPLDGTAHTWHHDTAVLLRVVADGGAASGGVMPPFGDVLTEAERLAVLAFVQSLWSEDTYRRWLVIETERLSILDSIF